MRGRWAGAAIQSGTTKKEDQRKESVYGKLRKDEIVTIKLDFISAFAFLDLLLGTIFSRKKQAVV